MSCQDNNASDPSPAIAPGAEAIDPRRAAEAWARVGVVHPTLTELLPSMDAPFFQAGLCGYSDSAMRIIARRHGCPLCVTEALLDRTLLAGGRGFAKADLGEIEQNVPQGTEDHPLVGQIMGSDPREMAAAAVKMIEQGRRADAEYRRLAYDTPGVHPSTRAARREISHGGGSAERIHLRLPGGEQIGWFDPRTEGADVGVRSASPSRTFAAIDVNLACPVKKIDRKARGGHWLAEPQGAIRILEAVREAVPVEVPCAVKLRRSYDDSPEMTSAFERILAAAYAIGYAWTTIHARTVAQKYVGPSRWDILREIVRANPGRVIFGSGDIWEAGDIFRMIAYTGVSGASVARGCIGNPWLFQEARDLMAGRSPAPASLEEQRGVLIEHFRLALSMNRRARRPEEFTASSMRKFGIRFARHHPRAEDAKRGFIGARSLADWERVVRDWYGSGDRAGLGEDGKGLAEPLQRA